MNQRITEPAKTWTNESTSQPINKSMNQWIREPVTYRINEWRSQGISEPLTRWNKASISESTNQWTSESMNHPQSRSRTHQIDQRSRTGETELSLESCALVGSYIFQIVAQNSWNRDRPWRPKNTKFSARERFHPWIHTLPKADMMWLTCER